jgi:hypothetical protein
LTRRFISKRKTSNVHRLLVHVSPQFTHFYAQIPTNPKRCQSSAIDFTPNCGERRHQEFSQHAHIDQHPVTRFVHFVSPLGFRAISF